MPMRARCEIEADDSHPIKKGPVPDQAPGIPSKPFLNWAVACCRRTRGVRTDHSRLVRENPARTARPDRLGNTRDGVARNHTARSRRVATFKRPLAGPL